MTTKRPRQLNVTTLKAVMTTGLACLLLTACGKEEAPVESKAPRPVKTVVLEEASGATGMRQYPGRVRAASRADLSFEVAGKLIELPVKEGQVVEEGDLIARLDDRDLSANLKSAQAEADNAAANFARGAKLVKDGHISKTDFDTLTSKRDVTAAELTKALKAVDDTRLLAPFSGRVATRLVENFQDVQAKEPIVRLQGIVQLEIVVDIPENRAIRIREEGREAVRVHAVFEGGYIGTSPNIAKWDFEIGFWPDNLSLTNGPKVNTWDANPAEVLYEVLTNDDFGHGKLSVYRAIYGQDPPGGSAPSLIIVELEARPGETVTIQLDATDPDEPASGLRFDVDREYDGTFEERGLALGIDDRGPAVDDLRIHTRQQVVVDSVETADLLLLVVSQGRPGKFRDLAVPAELAGIFQGVIEFRGVDVQLLGYAAHVDTGAAHVAVFRHGDSGAESRGHARGAYAAGAGPDNKQVVVHFPPSSIALVPGGAAILWHR